MRLRWVVLAAVVAALLAPAVSMTAARLVDPTGGVWVRLVSFTPYALVPYLAASLLLLVASLRARARWRLAVRGLTLLGLAGLAVHAYWASAPFLGNLPERAGARVRVMTANLFHGQADCDRVVRIALDRGVDVLVLQEVTPRALRRLRTTGIDDAFPVSAGRSAADTSGTLVFSSTPLTNVRRLDTAFGSYAMDVRLRGVGDGEGVGENGIVHLVAVHPRPPVGDAKAWFADHRVIRRAAQGREGPTMVVGDLNATMDHAPMRDLVGLGFRDAATESRSGWQPTWPSSGKVSRLGVRVPPVVAIDHVLTAGPLHAVETESLSVHGTDHRVVVAALDP